MKNIISIFVVLSFLFMTVCISTSDAKFLCEVEKIDGTTLILKNCQEKGLKRLKPGDSVSIVKKRKPKLEGC